MSIVARLFVGIVFIILGLSFFATTAALIWEFDTIGWFSLATFYSHLFIFFPTFGIVALVAFYMPAVIFTDMYWNHVKFGPVRYVVGFTVLIVGSFTISNAILKGDERTLFEVTPEVLAADLGNPSNCNVNQQSCKRQSVLTALATVRSISGRRVGLSPFSRNCRPDPLFAIPESYFKERRFCFVTDTLASVESSGGLTTTEECCQAQDRFSRFMTNSYARPGNRSLTGQVHEMLLPFKVFFLLILLTVGLLLAIRYKSLKQDYADWTPWIERGVLTGVFAMLFWPIMNHAFLHSAAVLYGVHGDSLFRTISPVFSLIFGGWGLLLLFYFYRSVGAEHLETIAKVSGVIVSGLAIWRYEEIVDSFVRFAGSGASPITVAILVILAVAVLLQMVLRPFPPEKPLTVEPVPTPTGVRVAADAGETRLSESD